MMAGNSRNQEVVEVLLAAGADPNVPDVDGDTPLHWAVRDSSFDNVPNPVVVEALLDAGADRLTRNAKGETPWDLFRRRERSPTTETYRRLANVLRDRP